MMDDFLWNLTEMTATCQTRVVENFWESSMKVFFVSSGGYALSFKDSKAQIELELYELEAK